MKIREKGVDVPKVLIDNKDNSSDEIIEDIAAKNDVDAINFLENNLPEVVYGIYNKLMSKMADMDTYKKLEYNDKKKLLDKIKILEKYLTEDDKKYIDILIEDYTVRDKDIPDDDLDKLGERYGNICTVLNEFKYKRRTKGGIVDIRKIKLNNYERKILEPGQGQNMNNKKIEQGFGLGR